MWCGLLLAPCCSSSAVEMMKVRVERTIIEREKNASSCARRLVHGYSSVFHSQLRTSLHTTIQIILPLVSSNLTELFPKSSSSAVSIALILALRSMSFSFWRKSTSGKYLRAQQASSVKDQLIYKSDDNLVTYGVWVNVPVIQILFKN